MTDFDDIEEFDPWLADAMAWAEEAEVYMDHHEGVRIIEGTANYGVR